MGDNVLWAYNAFGSAPFLKLSHAGSNKVFVDQPFAVKVGTNSGSDDGHEGASVGAVDAIGHDEASGVATGSTSDGDGAATITFHQTGWQRVKAREINPVSQKNDAIPSNSLDVCVVTEIADECDGTPPSQLAKIPDLEAPVIAVSTPLDNSATTASSVLLNYTVIDNYGLAPSCSSSSGASIPLDLGLNAVYLSCEDIFGNSMVRNIYVTREAAFATDPTGPTKETPARQSAGRRADPKPAEPIWLTAKALSLSCVKRCRKTKNKLVDGGSVTRISKGGAAKFKLAPGVPLLRVAGNSRRAVVKLTLRGKTVKITVPSGRKIRVIPVSGLTRGGIFKFSVSSGSIDLDAVAVSP